jgi:hypothetical protein
MGSYLYTVYALKGKKAGNIFYIGVTINPLKWRLTQHLQSTSKCIIKTASTKNQFISYLLSVGDTVLIEPLAEFSSCSRDSALLVESEQIRLHVGNGLANGNNTNGQYFSLDQLIEKRTMMLKPMTTEKAGFIPHRIADKWLLEPLS